MAPDDTDMNNDSTSPSSDMNDESTGEAGSYQRRKILRRECQKKKRLSKRSSIESTSPSSDTNDESTGKAGSYQRRKRSRRERQKKKRLPKRSSINKKMAPDDTDTNDESTSPSSDTNDESTGEAGSYQRRKILRRERQKKKRLSKRSSIKKKMAPDDTDTNDESPVHQRWRKRKDCAVEDSGSDDGLEVTVSRRRVASESDQNDIERSNLSGGEASICSNEYSQSEGQNESNSESDINSESSATVMSSVEGSVGHADDVEDYSLRPVCAGSAVTRGTFEALLLALSKKHKFSKSAKQDLLKLMHTVVSEPNLPSSNYEFEKDLFREIGIQYQKCQLCPLCQCELEREHCVTNDCPNFEQSPQDKEIPTFYIIPLADQLKKVLAENWESILQYKLDHEHRAGVYKDICCGKLYRGQEGCDDPTKLISLVFHIDGAPAVKSKNMSLWPMQCFVVELPYGLRYSFKNILFCGLWCGSKKPPMRLFQSHFVDQVRGMSGTPLEFIAGETLVTVRKVKVHGHLADLVAKAPSLNMKQFNGEFGCSVCFHPGERLQGRGNVRVYPQYVEEPARRNHRDTLLHAQLAEESGKSVFGVMGTSPLHRVLHIPDNVLLDYMHLVLEGEFMRRLTMWLDGSGLHGYLHEHKEELEAAMKEIRFPHDFNRKLRSFSEIKRWKDREVQNFFLHVSLPLLKPFLPLEYFLHLSLLVTGIWLLTFDDITDNDIAIAKMLLSNYARLVEVIYGKRQVTYTVHGLQHLPEQVANFGPLILHSGFVFEAMISHLKRLFHGTRCIPEQIVRNLVMSQSSSGFIKANTTGEEVSSLATQLICPKKHFNAQRVCDGIYLFNPMQRDPPLSDAVLEAMRPHVEQPNPCVQMSTRMMKNGQVFHSLSYKRRGQSCSYIVQFQEGRNCIKHGTVICFLLLNNTPFAVIKVYESAGRNISSNLDEPDDEMMKSFHRRGLLGFQFAAVKESEQIKLIHCRHVLRRCILVTSEEEEVDCYLCPVLKHYEHD